MASTPGTQFRTGLVRQLRHINRQMRWLTGVWTPYGTVNRTRAEKLASKDGRWSRPRERHEYPEHRAQVLHESYRALVELEGVIKLLQGQVQARYREVLAEQQREIKKGD